MNLYLDASVLIAIFVSEARSPDAHKGILGELLIVSDLAVAEFSAGVAKRQRMGDMSATDATHLFVTFDAWVAGAAQRATIETGDLLMANTLIRSLDLGLRAPDATNLAIAQRLAAKVFTFDKTMATAASVIGLEVVT